MRSVADWVTTMLAIFIGLPAVLAAPLALADGDILESIFAAVVAWACWRWATREART